MKKILFTLLICASTILLHAQTYSQAIGIQLGYANPVYRLNSPDSPEQQKANLFPDNLRGVKIGFNYDATLIRGFGLNMAINYTFAGTQTNWNDYRFDINGKPITNKIYPLDSRPQKLYQSLELAIDWQYKFEIAHHTWLILYTGPTMQCGLQRINKDQIRYKNQTEIEKVEKSNYYEYENDPAHSYNRINVTWGIGVGFQYGRYFIRGGYDFGLMNPYYYHNFNKMGYGFDRNTRGRLDQWQVKLGIYIWND